MESISLEERLFLIDDNSLIEASDTVWSNVKVISVCEESEGVGVVDLVRSRWGCERDQNIIDNMKNLKGREKFFYSSCLHLIRFGIYSLWFIDFDSFARFYNFIDFLEPNWCAEKIE